jgi:hypothetical protein
MQKTTMWVLVAIIGIVGIAAIIYVTTKTVEPVAPTAREEAQQQDALMPTKTIQVKHQYKDGNHTFMGMIETPTPCYNVTAVILPGDVPEIKITTQEQPDTICAQVISEKQFTVRFTGPEDTQFLTTVNDEPVNMNQFDIDPDVDIESVEIFIKG